MALEHILLGLLREPGSGSDIKRAFDEAIGHFWAAELSQVYPMLNRMAHDGLLEAAHVPSDKGPPRKVYSLTATGRERLHEWLGGQPVIGQERLEWLAQVWFLNEMPERALPFMVSLRAEFARELATLEAIDAHWRSSDPRYPDKLPDTDLFPQFTLALGLKKLRVKLEWADDCIALLEARAASRR